MMWIGLVGFVVVTYLAAWLDTTERATKPIIFYWLGALSVLPFFVEMILRLA